MSERDIKRRTRELIGQWHTAAFGLSEDELIEDWARERALLEAEVERLRRQARMLAPVVNAALRPSGKHRLIDGYCPDCGGSCLVGFGNPAPPSAVVEP